MKPKRIQRKRTKGWKMPPNTINVTRPGKFGNPFKVEDFASAQACVKMFKTHRHSFGYPSDDEVRAELCGKNLACWCALGQPCHAEVLLEIANAEPEEREESVSA